MRLKLGPSSLEDISGGERPAEQQQRSVIAGRAAAAWTVSVAKDRQPVVNELTQRRLTDPECQGLVPSSRLIVSLQSSLFISGSFGRLLFF